MNCEHSEKSMMTSFEIMLFKKLFLNPACKTAVKMYVKRHSRTVPAWSIGGSSHIFT